MIVIFFLEVGMRRLLYGTLNVLGDEDIYLKDIYSTLASFCFCSKN